MCSRQTAELYTCTHHYSGSLADWSTLLYKAFGKAKQVPQPYMMIMCNYTHGKMIMVGPDKPDSDYFELVSSHQQEYIITCLAHNPALYTRRSKLYCVWFHDACGSGQPRCLWLIVQLMYMYTVHEHQHTTVYFTSLTARSKVLWHVPWYWQQTSQSLSGGRPSASVHWHSESPGNRRQ